MHGANDTLYYRYGAYELKARYQANLMLGQLLAVSLVGLGLAISGLWPREQTVVVPSFRHVDSVRVVMDLPPTIIRTVPSPGRPAQPTNDRMIIPEPVSDSLADNDLIRTRDELRSMVGTDTVVEPGDSGGLFDTSAPDLINDPTVFIVREVEPEQIDCPSPEYPRFAINARMEGKAAVQAFVDVNGNVRRAQVARTSGWELLDSAAVRSAYKCTYKPAIQNGRPIAVWVTYIVRFRLEDAK